MDASAGKCFLITRPCIKWIITLLTAFRLYNFLLHKTFSNCLTRFPAQIVDNEIIAFRCVVYLKTNLNIHLLKIKKCVVEILPTFQITFILRNTLCIGMRYRLYDSRNRIEALRKFTRRSAFQGIRVLCAVRIFFEGRQWFFKNDSSRYDSQW